MTFNPRVGALRQFVFRHFLHEEPHYKVEDDDFECHGCDRLELSIQ